MLAVPPVSIVTSGGIGASDAAAPDDVDEAVAMADAPATVGLITGAAAIAAAMGVAIGAELAVDEACVSLCWR